MLPHLFMSPDRIQMSHGLVSISTRVALEGRSVVPTARNCPAWCCFSGTTRELGSWGLPTYWRGHGSSQAVAEAVHDGAGLP